VHGLDILYGTRSRLAVLRVLYFSDDPLPGREVQRRAKLSNRAAMTALADLADRCIVHCDYTSTCNLYRLNRANYYVRKVLRSGFDAEIYFWDDLRRIVRRVVKPRPIAAVASGPSARREDLPTGLVTVTLLFETGHERIRALKTVPRLQAEIKDRLTLDSSVRPLDTNNMHDGRFDPLWREIEREGLVLFGTLIPTRR
jgi:hypothetical protein